MIYCINCLYPNTKPDLIFNEKNICSACQNFKDRLNIDWDNRKKDFFNICEKYSKPSNYDCIVPVSGGKDSTFQVITLLQMGLKPLCIAATTDSLSQLGRYNIENLKKLGVDYIEYTLNYKIRRYLNKFCLEKIGDISWPEHVSIFTTPVKMAVAMNIPLIIWGENSQNEYGGPASAVSNNILNRKWLEEFGGLLGFRVMDLIDVLGFSEKDLVPYTYPSQDSLDKVGVTGLFLGYYVPWDGLSNAIIAQSHEFRTYEYNVEGSICNYENLDNYQTGIHDYFKYLKYGFGRATDIANNHIRRGRLRRSDAIELVKIHDGAFPWTCLGKPINEILEEINLTFDEFIMICDRFTNKSIFLTDNHGKFIKDKKMNLKKITSL